MNCHHARQLISPYLDGQLTGREMLALGDHLAECACCHDEMRSLKQVKLLLRGLHRPAPRVEFSRQLTSQEILFPGEQGKERWKPAGPPADVSVWSQRSRRAATVLALSCVTLVALAPASREAHVASSVLPTAPFAAPRLTARLTLSASPAVRSEAFQFGAPPRHGFLIFSSGDVSGHIFSYAPPFSNQPYEPSMTSFSSGQVTLARYPSR